MLLGLGLLLGVLAFHAYATVEPVPARSAPAASPAPGQILRMDGDREQHRTVPGRTVELAFYGGPNPRWTSKILDTLAAKHAHATFLITGAKANQYPELVRRMVAEGHEVGLAGFRPAEVSERPQWRRKLELAFSQAALASAAGVHARLFGPSASLAIETVHQLGREGYLLVTPDIGSEELPWGDLDQLPAIAAPGTMVRIEEAGSGAVDVTRDLLAVLGPRGYRFSTVSEGLGLPPMTHAGFTDRMTGHALAWSQRYGGVLVFFLNTFIAVAAILAVLRTLMQLGLAHTARRLRREPPAERPPWFTPPVTVVVPAYNEAANIVGTVRSLVASTGTAELEVIVVDDGSTDGTAELVESLGLHRVRVIRQPNGGKPAALNTGIAAAGTDILVLVDGDTIFEPDTVGQLVQPLADQQVGAVSGNAKVANRSGMLGRWQHLEYCAGANLDRQILNVLQCIPTIPGAVGAFRREALADVGGISAHTIAEDTDLTIAINRAGWRVSYEPAARAWTEVPGSLHGLYRQRYRWSYGTFQAMWKHRGALKERGAAGRMGRYGLIYLLLYHLLLPLLAPVMDIYVLYGLFIADAPRALVIWTIFLLLQTASAGYALRLDGESLRPLWGFPLQQLVYRQLTYVIVIQSLITALHGTRLRWQTAHRTGQAARTLSRSMPRSNQNGRPG